MPDRAYISKIKLPSGSEYYLKDEEARELIEELSGYTEYLGVSTTALAEGTTTNPITIGGQSVTAKKGDIATYQKKEFIFNGTQWQEFGDLSGLGALAYKDSATGTYTPAGSVGQPTFAGTSKSVSVTGTATGTVAVSVADVTGSGTSNYTPKGTVSKPTFTGSATTSTGEFTPAGNVSFTNTNQSTTVSKASGTGAATYTPEGTVAVSVKTAGATTTVNSITSVGTLPELTTTVSNEMLTIGFSQGTLPAKEDDITVKTGDAAYNAGFTGTGVRLVTGNISVPSSASFTGTKGNVSVTGTPSGEVSQPTFSGTKANITSEFTGGSFTSTGTYKPEGTVSKPTWTGTEADITVS